MSTLWNAIRSNNKILLFLYYVNIQLLTRGVLMSWVEIRLDNILNSKGISRRELARKTNIRHSTINEMCNNTAKRIPLENIASICDELEIEISELFKLHRSETKKEE